MIRFYFNLAPNPMKIALMLEELGEPYEAMPVDNIRYDLLTQDALRGVIRTVLVNAVEGRTIHEILGSPDDLKFRSSMTLFAALSSEPEFAAAIGKFYDGTPDPKTLELLGG